jgi:hypothetical protein
MLLCPCCSAGKRELALRSEHSARVDEAEARCKELQATLNEQRIAYDMLLVGGLLAWLVLVVFVSTPWLVLGAFQRHNPA